METPEQRRAQARVRALLALRPWDPKNFVPTTHRSGGQLHVPRGADLRARLLEEHPYDHLAVLGDALAQKFPPPESSEPQEGAK